jgi:HIT zinc finger
MDISYKIHEPFGKISYLCCTCSKKQAKYICPRCQIPYCSIKCYKSHNSNCSEEFYREQVLIHLNSKKTEKSEVKKMHNILNSNQYTSDPILSEILSDSQYKRLEEIESIASKPNPLEHLTQQEKQELSDFVRSGKAFRYISEWKPWWTDENLETSEISQSDRYLSTPEIYKLNKSPSHLLLFHIFEVIWSNVYAWRSFNGDKSENIEEVMGLVIKISKVFKGKNCNFDSIEGSLMEILQEIYTFDQDIALGISNAVTYDCYLIFSCKWNLIKLLFEIQDFFTQKTLPEPFYSANKPNLKLISKKLLFFISYIKFKSEAELKSFSRLILDYYNTIKNIYK